MRLIKRMRGIWYETFDGLLFYCLDLVLYFISKFHHFSIYFFLLTDFIQTKSDPIIIIYVLEFFFLFFYENFTIYMFFLSNLNKGKIREFLIIQIDLMLSDLSFIEIM